ncbi:MAG TPA: nicotinate-nucleotide adenylyltransferase [Candidatus Mediterraneibacter merdavium]|nr:nicotinate-nucleotide adenylyltransferase [Candidatus Mediterraneibacter merdavium]
MKVGIMGGTFDPIHIGHLLLGEFAYEDFHMDEIWFMPNRNPPHKVAEHTEEAMHHRIEMVKLAVRDVPHFSLSLYEAETEAHSYTYSTLREFNRRCPDDDFYFILGADSLFAIEEWRNFEEIFPACTILAAMRDDKDAQSMQLQIDYLSERYGARIELLRAPLVEISSTTIRRRASLDLSVRYMVPDAVADYIKRHQLYKKRG